MMFWILLSAAVLFAVWLVFCFIVPAVLYLRSGEPR